jgi:Caspase domain
MRKALIVGINNYPTAPLKGCVNDATRVKNTIEKNYDGSPNFDCKMMLAPSDTVTRASLRENLERLFATESDVALFYFSGHGTITKLGGFLVTQDATRYDEGLSMTTVLALAQQAKAHEVVIVLDCCHSGSFGAIPTSEPDTIHLRRGISVLAASEKDEAAVEINGEGLFTALVCDALNGGAADIVGDVTAAAVYAHVDGALGPWDQRPQMMANVSKLLKLRRAEPQMQPETLRQLPDVFPSPDEQLQLDPTFEPTAAGCDPDKIKTFALLQKFYRCGLVTPVGVEHMYDAAMQTKTCVLTPKGRYYWRVVSSNRI